MSSSTQRIARSMVVVVVSATLLFAGTARASQVRPLNLERLEESADRVFLGRVEQVTRRLDEQLGMPVFQVTLRLERCAKGPRSDSVTIRILDTGGKIPGLAGFIEGEEVVLFLYPDSDRGLTSPVGLGQGRFTVQRDKQGRRFAINPYGNRELLRGLSENGRRAAGERLVGRANAAVDPSDLLDAAVAVGANRRGRR